MAAIAGQLHGYRPVLLHEASEEWALYEAVAGPLVDDCDCGSEGRCECDDSLLADTEEEGR